MSTAGICPDGGTCHHDCPLTAEGRGFPCFRVLHASPLSIVGYPDDRWPEGLRALHADTEGGVIPVEQPFTLDDLAGGGTAHADHLGAVRAVCSITVEHRAGSDPASAYTATLDVQDGGEQPDTVGIGHSPLRAVLSLVVAYGDTLSELTP